ncbi:MAG: cobalamin-dependent protein, partial [Pseudomonadota bacterium]|nr:cobalamin-dependent protein [Pseudomonadota bacterium]
GRNIMEPSIDCAGAGVTTGEWGDVLRRVFGEYRAATGVDLSTRAAPSPTAIELRGRVAALAARLGTPVRFLVGKPGLDGHSNGAEQIALRASACGMEVSYDGIRFSPEEIARVASERKVHLVGLSILSGAHVSLVRDVMNRLREAGLGHVPVVVGGIIPAPDVAILRQCGAAAVYTPKDFALDRIVAELITLVEQRLGEAPESDPGPGRRPQSALRRNAQARRPPRR